MDVTLEIKEIINKANMRLGEAMLKVAMDTIGNIKNRIVYSGVDADGNKYAPYSTKPMYASCKNMTKKDCVKIVGSKQKRRELEWVTLKRGDKNIRLFILPEGYKQYREITNHQTNFVDFAFSGDMWKNIQVASNEADHRNGIAMITATDDAQYKKLEGNTKRKGDILAMNEDEINHAVEVLEEILFKDWE